MITTEFSIRRLSSVIIDKFRTPHSNKSTVFFFFKYFFIFLKISIFSHKNFFKGFFQRSCYPLNFFHFYPAHLANLPLVLSLFSQNCIVHTFSINPWTFCPFYLIQNFEKVCYDEVVNCQNYQFPDLTFPISCLSRTVGGVCP